MDFFSLFDPSDGQTNNKKTQQDAANKKTEGGKGRRRSRRPQVTSECLEWEESSFLCVAGLTPDAVQGSYIDSCLQECHDGKDLNLNKRPKRRNSSHKTRRKKCSTPTECLTDDKTTDSESKASNWNNKKVKPSIYDENVGKNVNDLKTNIDTENKDSKNNTEKCETIDRNDNIDNCQKIIENDTTIDKRDNFKEKQFDSFSEELNKILNKNTSYNFDSTNVNDIIDRLDKVNIIDRLYVSGDLKDENLKYSTDSDSSYDSDSSSSRPIVCLPPEPRFGNVEYKLQLLDPPDKRFEHLVTQLKWRCVSGGGSAVYIIGARDDGALLGLQADKLLQSLRTLQALAKAATAQMSVNRIWKGVKGNGAEVHITMMPDSQQTSELRVAVMGANEAGKSTLIGVLTQGELDNGLGAARLNMFRHVHEVRSGRTSSLSHEILGFDKQGNVVNYGCCSLMTAARIGAASERLVAFLDHPGHGKYMRTTYRGLSGYEPHYCCLVISSTAGITNITEEHLSIVQALDLPFFIVINKCDLAPNAATVLVDALQGIIRNKKLLLVTDDQPYDNSYDDDVMSVFAVSCVTGVGLSALRRHLRKLPFTEQRYCTQERCEFQIDEIFHVGENGPIVGGLLAEGQIFEGDELIIGPLEDGSFAPCRVASIYRNRCRCLLVRGPHWASLRLLPEDLTPRAGQVLLHQAGYNGDTDGGDDLQLHNLQSTLSSLSKVQKNKKNMRRKNKNAPKQKETEIGRVECANETQDKAELSDVILEDPSRPRGCIYFQATIQVLRHASAICPGFQCTVHVGNVRQTAVIEGILSSDGSLRTGGAGSVVFRFVLGPEFLRTRRRLLLTQGLGTRAIGRVTQVFPYFP